MNLHDLPLTTEQATPQASPQATLPLTATTSTHAHPAPWLLARRTQRMNPSVIREILKVTERPGVISFAGGLPSPHTFPVAEFAQAAAQVLAENGQAALQYAASEGYAPLREAVAASLPWAVDASQVIITNGSQQGLDLVGKLLIDPGSRVLVESPTYLGALQAFAPMEPEVEGLASDAEGPCLQDLARALAEPRSALRAHTDGLHGTQSAHGMHALQGQPLSARARFLYVLPNFQNPTGRSMSEPRRAALAQMAAQEGLPLVEDNPYGELWFDAPPPAPLAARHPQGCIYLGSFSKVLAPGLRLGFIVAPQAVVGRLLQAKQAADLHSPIFNQRLVARVLEGGFLERHVPTIRARYKAQRDAMLSALQQQLGGSGVQWNSPEGGMFLWLRLPEGLNAQDLLPLAVARGVAFVPGAPFCASQPDLRSLRLSFVTPDLPDIARGVAALAAALAELQNL